MSDFQKLTLKRYGRNFLIVCGLALLCYGGVKFELVRYAVLAILTLTVVGGCAWAIIRLVLWRNEEYLSTEEQIQEMMDTTSIDSDILWSMFERLS